MNVSPIPFQFYKTAHFQQATSSPTIYQLPTNSNLFNFTPASPHSYEFDKPVRVFTVRGFAELMVNNAATYDYYPCSEIALRSRFTIDGNGVKFVKGESTGNPIARFSITKQDLTIIEGLVCDALEIEDIRLSLAMFNSAAVKGAGSFAFRYFLEIGYVYESDYQEWSKSLP